ncbi:MAG: mycothiol synthase [Lacisediminihabitans sp.]
MDKATRVDGQPPFSDQSLVDLADGARKLVLAELDGSPAAAALVTVGDGPTEAELVVDPDARHHGLGGLLLSELIGHTRGELLIWAHGDHPDARTLAARHSLDPVRELLQLRAPVAEGLAFPAALAFPAVLRAFRPGLDDDSWLALNARAFASHPEQGKLTRSDLDARIAEPWFDADDFLLAHSADGTLLGFCWLKVEGEFGEFYAVGVDPKQQGEGLGRTLVLGGLARLSRRGIREANLYVDAENATAVTLYRSLGFTDYSIDIQYELKRG